MSRLIILLKVGRYDIDYFSNCEQHKFLFYAIKALFSYLLLDTPLSGMTLIKIESKSGSGVKALSAIVLFIDKYQGNVIIDNESNSRLY